MDLSRAFDVNRALSHAWEGIRRCGSPLFVGGFLMWFTGNSSSGFNVNLGDLDSLRGIFDDSGPSGFSWGGDPPNLTPLEQLLHGSDGEVGLVLGVMAGTMLCALAVSLFFFLVRAWLSVGWLRLHRAVVTEGEASVGPLFSGADRALDMILWRVMRGMIVLGTTVVAASPALVLAYAAIDAKDMMMVALATLVGVVLVLPVTIYVGLGLYLGDHALVLEGLSPMEALERSWSLASGNRLSLLVFAVAMGVVYLLAITAGVMMMCFGLVITGPLSVALNELALSEAYLIAIEGEDAAREWGLVKAAGGL